MPSSTRTIRTRSASRSSKRQKGVRLHLILSPFLRSSRAGFHRPFFVPVIDFAPRRVNERMSRPPSSTFPACRSTSLCVATIARIWLPWTMAIWHSSSTLVDAAMQRDCDLHAYVLMTNHVHLLATGKADGAPSPMMQDRRTTVCALLQRPQGAHGQPFRGRFRASVVDSDRYFSRLHALHRDESREVGTAASRESVRVRVVESRR